MAAHEKRDITRQKKRLTIRFGIDEATRVAFTEDLSRTGMFIKTPNTCLPNSKIRIEFEIADKKVELHARVMWAKKVPHNLFHLVKKCGMGVRFLHFHSGEEHFSDYFENQVNPLPSPCCEETI
ncbi:MAG: PilZ domain-containing protein [Desulfuromonadales bacterium]|nr:PilZ domain-containing protein [Desulfuromonadales bacterium]